MPVTLEGLNSTPRSDTLNSVCLSSFPALTLGAGVVNTASQDVQMLGVNFKIRKVAVSFTSIDSTAGTDLFNIVVGTGAYSQNNPAQNDNSFDPLSTTTVGVSAQNNATVLGGLGYPTNVATVGQSVFATDLAFTAANFPNIATATGGYAVFVPTNYDAVYPGNIPMTLRVTTTATTGAIATLRVIMTITPIRLRPAPQGAQNYAAVPGIDY